MLLQNVCVPYSVPLIFVVLTGKTNGNAQSKTGLKLNCMFFVIHWLIGCYVTFPPVFGGKVYIACLVVVPAAPDVTYSLYLMSLSNVLRFKY